ncbi:hypothetical protein [Novosphingobium sp. MMS21-SN21R]|uniref:hypothetical protein n=1 Tax=Novosphingobium sp. MMS21-SN21R TaxID=2969298 RepID=UPI0028884ECB|nr:hypothetical protein [Novosphingobium sp. MMS21-SN21R]MDT0508165.1 hypothetical protein [Novosphingobium sp. MMS21-SN21R]
MINTPSNPIVTADQRQAPTFSLSSSAERITANIGAVNQHGRLSQRQDADHAKRQEHASAADQRPPRMNPGTLRFQAVQLTACQQPSKDGDGGKELSPKQRFWQRDPPLAGQLDQQQHDGKHHCGKKAQRKREHRAVMRGHGTPIRHGPLRSSP